jgi:thymidylate synthase (FAD)
MKQEQIFAEYRDHMGSDLTVVNAARSSFGKESDWVVGPVVIEPDPQDPEATVWSQPKSLKPADANLIRFLATGYRTAEWDVFLDQIIDTVLHMEREGTVGTAKDELTTMLRAYKRKAQHWAPFAHCQVQIRVRMPIFLARQFVKHQVGGVWSEESRRYISDEPGVWFPTEWHTRPDDIKQGSGAAHPNQQLIKDAAHAAASSGLHWYSDMLRAGVAPEEARIVLPLNMMTTVVWTGSLLFWSRVVNLRADSHAQLAAQELGKLISGIVAPLYPTSWKELTT